MKARTFPSAALLAFVLALLPIAAARAQYAGDTGPLGVSDTTLDPGSPVTVSGSGFDPGSRVRITIESTPRTLTIVTVDGGGDVTATVKIPADISAGTHTLRAIGVTPDGTTLALSQEITIGGELALTGADVGTPVAVVGLLLVLGLGTIWAARRRSSSAR